MKSGWHKKAVILLILLLGLALRVHDLSRESLWLDEGASIRVAQLEVPQIIRDISVNFHPPGYFLLLHLWIDAFGDSEFSVRFLSVIFGFLAICLIGRVGWLLFDLDTGILAAFLLSVSRFNIYYSQECRMYALVLLLALASMYFFISLLTKGGAAAAAGYVVCSGFLLYTHNVGIFIIAAQNLWLVGDRLVARRESFITWKKWFFLQGLLLLLYLPWLFILLRQVGVVSSRASWTVPRPDLGTLFHTFEGFSGSRTIKYMFAFFGLLALAPLLKYKAGKGPLSAPPGPETAAPGLFGLKSTRSFLLSWLLVPLLVPFLVSLLLFPIYIHKP